MSEVKTMRQKQRRVISLTAITFSALVLAFAGAAIANSRDEISVVWTVSRLVRSAVRVIVMSADSKIVADKGVQAWIASTENLLSKAMPEVPTQQIKKALRQDLETQPLDRYVTETTVALAFFFNEVGNQKLAQEAIANVDSILPSLAKNLRRELVAPILETYDPKKCETDRSGNEGLANALKETSQVMRLVILFSLRCK